MNKVVDNYILLEKLGAGQFAEVFKGKDRLNDMQVAIKVYSLQKFLSTPKLKEMILNEIKALSELNSTNIIHYYKMLKTANNIYLIYEYCDSHTLEDYIITKKFLSEKEALQLLKQLSYALKELLLKNIIHRDIKPSNILLTSSGLLKLADFGLCKFLDPSQEQMEKLETILNNAIQEKTLIVGSPIYMAPELLKGQPLNKKIDLYSMGIVLYEMLFGVCPFEDSNVENLIIKIERNILSFPLEKNQISLKTQNLLREMLKPDPHQRIEWEKFFNFFEENVYIQPKSEYSNEDIYKNNMIGEKYKKPLAYEDNMKIKEISINPEKVRNESSKEIFPITENFSSINKKLLKEKNKIVYISNVINASLDLNLNNLTVLAVISLLKLQILIYENLSDILYQEIPKQNTIYMLKTSYEEWIKFKRSDDYRIYSKIIQEELMLLKENFLNFIGIAQNNSSSFKMELKYLELSREGINEILYYYCKTVQAHIFELLSLGEKDLAKKILIHANNVLDAMGIEEFFEKLINEEVLKIDEQNYFGKLLSFPIPKYLKLIEEKLSFFSKLIKKM